MSVYCQTLVFLYVVWKRTKQILISLSGLKQDYSPPFLNTTFHCLALGDFSFEKVIQCSSISSARTLALSGCGLTFQLSGEVAKYVQKGELIQLFPNYPIPQHQIYAVTSHRTQSAKINAVLTLLKTAFGE